MGQFYTYSRGGQAIYEMKIEIIGKFSFITPLTPQNE